MAGVSEPASAYQARIEEATIIETLNGGLWLQLFLAGFRQEARELFTAGYRIEHLLLTVADDPADRTQEQRDLEVTFRAEWVRQIERARKLLAEQIHGEAALALAQA